MTYKVCSIYFIRGTTKSANGEGGSGPRLST